MGRKGKYPNTGKKKEGVEAIQLNLTEKRRGEQFNRKKEGRKYKLRNNVRRREGRT